MTPLPNPSGHRRRGLHAHVVDQLGRTIVTDGPESGVSLVTDDLSKHFDVSRTVIREAFRTLESKGLIGARPNTGTHIRPISEWHLLDPDIIEWRAAGPHSDDQRHELHALRWVVEMFAVRLTAGTDNRDTWALMAAAAFAMDDALRNDQVGAFDHADTTFHQHLIKASGNPLLNHLAATVTQGLTAYAQPTTCNRTTTSVNRHMALVTALRQDSEKAEHAMRDLLTTNTRPTNTPPENTPPENTTIPRPLPVP